MDSTFQQWVSSLMHIDSNPKRYLNWLLQSEGIDLDLHFVTFSNLSPSIQMRLQQKYDRLLKGEPISKILETQDFFGFSFKTNRHTLDPRLDTEVMITAAKDVFDIKKPLRFLDLGTGTGCVIITLLKLFENATGVGVDICQNALDVARQNALTHNVFDRISFVKSDWLKDLPHEPFDGIFSNPPYILDHESIDDSVKLYDPPLALFGGVDGLNAYRDIFSNLSPFSHPQTLYFFEVSDFLAQSVVTLGLQHALNLVTIRLDQMKRQRVVIFK